MRRKTIHELIDERYEDPDVAATILKRVEEAGTAEDIISGKLTLPSSVDAHNHHYGHTAEWVRRDTERRKSQ